MPRPKKCRRICSLPEHDSFGPLKSGRRPTDDVEMTVDEYEAVRLIDLLGCTQEECAAQMGVARTTVQAVYDSARSKLAGCLVHGSRLFIRGGDYQLCPDSGGCRGKNCGSRACGRRRCACTQACIGSKNGKEGI